MCKPLTLLAPVVAPSATAVPVAVALRAENAPGSDGKPQPERRIALDCPELAWRMIFTPAERERSLPGPEVLDLWTLLLALHREQGSPTSGMIWFSRYEVVQRLGWVPPGGKPGGEQYRRLARAFHHLHTATYVEGDPGDPEVGGAILSLLSGTWFEREFTGRKAAGAPREYRSHTRLTPDVLELLGDAEGLVLLDVDEYFGLPAGTPRIVYRLLQV